MADFTQRRAALMGLAGVGGLSVAALAGASMKKAQNEASAGDESCLGAFLPKGDGAVRRSVADKLGETISIEDFGATVAASDNKDAIELAVSNALQSGRSLYVPSGTFRYSQIDFRKNDATSPARLVISGPGTLKSTFPGFSFISSRGYFYDLVIDQVRFESEPGAGTTLLDGDKFIRLIFTPGTQINDFDWVITANKYLQSVRMIGAIVRGGGGAVVRAAMAYDCVFTHNIIEFVTDGIVIDGSNDPAVHTCAIDNNIIEGIGGRAIVLGTCMASTVCGNYMEGNGGGDILLNAGTAPHKGLKVQSNSIQIRPARMAANGYGIVWGASTALPVKAGGNFCTGRLHDTAGVTAIIDMTGDFSSVELYRGYEVETQPGRAPVGRAIFNDGLAQHIAWFDRYLAFDPHQNEIRFGGKHKSEVNGLAEPPILAFGQHSPQAAPADYERKNWARGSVVFNVKANKGQPAGWMCVSAGSPGIWASLSSLI